MKDFIRRDSFIRQVKLSENTEDVERSFSFLLRFFSDFFHFLHVFLAVLRLPNHWLLAVPWVVTYTISYSFDLLINSITEKLSTGCTWLLITALVRVVTTLLGVHWSICIMCHICQPSANQSTTSKFSCGRQLPTFCSTRNLFWKASISPRYTVDFKPQETIRLLFI